MFRIAAALMLSLCLAVGAGPAGAQSDPMQDADYVVIDPPVGKPGPQIEVVEFFYYGCAACSRFEPHLNRWAAALPEDVRLARVPALRNTSWIPLTRLFFALDQLGVLPQLHAQVYRDIHENGLNLGDSTRAADWAQRNGLDRSAMLGALEADGMASRLQQARDLTAAYGVRNTPSMVVDGRYLTSAAMTGSIEALLPVVEGLIGKARQSRIPK